MHYIVSAWAQGHGLVLGQLKVAEKSNEITALRRLLRVLELAGCIVTIDAMGCQKTIARAVRGHWGVENSLHWCLDVQMGEDQSRARTGHAPENLATLRRLALNLLKRDRTKKRGLKGKQLNAAWDHAYLRRLLAF